MANYAFETIPLAQATSYDASVDSLQFGDTAAHGSTVTVMPVLTVASASVSAGQLQSVVLYDAYTGVTQTFGTGLQNETITFVDNSVLYIGSDSSGAGDIASGGSGDDGLYGFGGDDQLSGGAGNDLILGNLGADTLTGGGGSDTLLGGKDNDVINATGNGVGDHDLVNGNRGDDTITADGDGSSIYGGQGNDLITDGAGANFISGDLGNDTIIGGDGNDTLSGGAGDDSVTSTASGSLVAHGDDGNDVISVSGVHNGAFDVNGGAGNDTLIGTDSGTGLTVHHGGAGDDLIQVSGATGFGTDAAKQIFGDAGNDTITDINTTNDVISGGDGNDSIVAGDATHAAVYSIDAGAGNDMVVVDHTATLAGAPANGADMIFLGDGDDTLTALGSNGTEIVDGGAGNDLIIAGPGVTNDTLAGGDGNDTIDASGHAGGVESLVGGAGDDVIIAGANGKDLMVGGQGSDTFSFAAHTSSTVMGSQDQILDWESGDKLQFGVTGSSANFSKSTGMEITDYAQAQDYVNNTLVGFTNIKYVAVQVGADVVVFSDVGGTTDHAFDAGDNAVVLVGRSLADVNASNIV
jgi:Ca2+-binding RTX toxin-like protein